MKCLLEKNKNDAAFSDLSQIYFLSNRINELRSICEEKNTLLNIVNKLKES